MLSQSVRAAKLDTMKWDIQVPVQCGETVRGAYLKEAVPDHSSAWITDLFRPFELAAAPVPHGLNPWRCWRIGPAGERVSDRLWLAIAAEPHMADDAKAHEKNGLTEGG
jgi:hypothetical protein